MKLSRHFKVSSVAFVNTKMCVRSYSLGFVCDYLFIEVLEKISAMPWTVLTKGQ